MFVILSHVISASIDLLQTGSDWCGFTKAKNKHYACPWMFDLLGVKGYYSMIMHNHLPCVSIGSVGVIPCLQSYRCSNALHGMSHRLCEMVRRTLRIPREPTRRGRYGSAWWVLEFESAVSKTRKTYFQKLNYYFSWNVGLLRLRMLKDRLCEKG